MNIVKFNCNVTIRDCKGAGCFSIVDDTFNSDDIQPTEIRFAITGNKDDYTMSLAAGRLMISVLLNSDHILIMKQILKEMGEI